MPNLLGQWHAALGRGDDCLRALRDVPWLRQGIHKESDVKRTNWCLTWFRGAPAIACHSEFNDGEFDGDSHTETFFVYPTCPRGRCGEGEPGVGCGCNGLAGDELVRFQIRNGPCWWSCWDDDVFDAEPLEDGQILKLVPLEVLAQWQVDATMLR